MKYKCIVSDFNILRVQQRSRPYWSLIEMVCLLRRKLPLEDTLEVVLMFLRVGVCPYLCQPQVRTPLPGYPLSEGSPPTPMGSGWSWVGLQGKLSTNSWTGGVGWPCPLVEGTICVLASYYIG